MPEKTQPKEPFKHFIAEYRMKAGLTQLALAKRMGKKTDMTVYRWENYESRVDMPILNAVAEALREPLSDDLLEGKDLLHHPDKLTADQLMRRLPSGDRDYFMRQLRNAVERS